MNAPAFRARPANVAAWWLLAILAAWVLMPFLSAIAWACVLAHATLPLHRWLGCRLPGGRTFHAVVSAALVALAAIGPVVGLALSARGELGSLMAWGSANLDRDVADILDFVGRLPWIGHALQGWFAGEGIGPKSVRDLLHQWTAGMAAWLLVLLGDVGRSLVRFGLTICFLFLLYAHDGRLSAAVRKLTRRMIGDDADNWMMVGAQASRAVVVSLLLAALAQGVVAGTGYWLVGLRAPVLLGLATAVASLLPLVGTLLVWGPASVYLVSIGQVWPALGLAAWGTFLIHPTDNILRPWLVSNAVHLPFLLMLLGAVGGLAGLGLIGIVLGPMVLAVAWEAVRKELPATPDR